MFILRISGWIYIDSDCNINSPTSRFIQTTDCRDIYIYIYIACIMYHLFIHTSCWGRLCIEWHFDAKKIAKCPMISAIRTISPWRKHVSIGSSDWSLQRFTPTTVHRSTWVNYLQICDQPTCEHFGNFLESNNLTNNFETPMDQQVNNCKDREILCKSFYGSENHHPLRKADIWWANRKGVLQIVFQMHGKS